MSVITLSLTSNLFDAYADEQEGTNYMFGKFDNAAWLAATEDEQGRALISATRLLDKQCWKGDKTSASQPLAWPRTGTGIDGVTDSVIPPDIISGAIELANLILTGSTVENNSLPGGQGLQVIKAGSVMLQYFRDAAGFLEQNARFPVVVQEFVGQYMCGAELALTGVATGTTSGTGVESVTGEDFGYSEGI